MNAYFTADTHFGHKNIIRLANRPFSSLEEMDETLFDAWQTTLKPDDILYHLGDVAFGNSHAISQVVDRIKKLPGIKYLVPGNHDNDRLNILSEAFTILPPLVTKAVKTCSQAYRVVLCHYPLLTWDQYYKNSLQFFGHVHGRISGNQRQIDVGVDVWGFAPVHFETLLQCLKTLPPHRNPEKMECKENNTSPQM